MQNKEQNALLLHRENYIVPKGEEHAVHYKIAKMTENGAFIERARIIKSRVKQFESIEKRNLEINGYTVEILHHPNGTYTNVRIEDKSLMLARQKDEIAELKAQLSQFKDKDDEIAKLKAEIEAMKKASEQEKSEEPEKPKKGRPSKGEMYESKKEA